jgi:hypothetical protein
MCTVLLPQGVNPIAVKYISYHHISYHIISLLSNSSHDFCAINLSLLSLPLSTTVESAVSFCPP